jgi:hypothetical protein
MKKGAPPAGKSPSALVEEWKWNAPVWSHDGILCTGETYK